MQDISQRYHIKKEGSKKYLYVDYRDTNVVASIADSPKVMAEVIGILAKHQDVDIIILLDVYEKMYDEKQTKMLKEVASLYVKYHKMGIWSPKYLGNIEKELPKRHRIIITVTHNLLRTDPIKAYIFLVESIKEEKQRLSLLEGNYRQDLLTFINTLEAIKKDFDNLELIKAFKNYLKDTGELPVGRSIYHTIFEPVLKPAFVSSKVFFRLPEQIELLDMYEIESAKVKILKHPDRIDVLYFLEPPEYNLDPDKYFLMIKARNIVSQHHPEGLDFSDISRVREEMINIYEKTLEGLANMMKLKITSKEISELAKIVARYTIGYGIIELFLRDRKLTDIYIDGPIEQSKVYGVHSEYGSFESNVILSEREAQSFISRLRALSGRPFDEAHPVLDFDLRDLQTRVAVIGPPLSPDGVAFALRLHKTTPWTLSQLIDVKTIDPFTAGLLSFLIDVQSSTLINGSRGAGKTSMLTALMLEILPSLRILVQEDTQEIPVEIMKELGFHIQRLKTQSAIGVARISSEVSPEDALRTALRLGDSVLIVGEVRSSLRGDQKVWIVYDGKPMYIEIEKIEKLDKRKINVPMLDFRDYKVKLVPLVDFVKHPKRSKFIKIKTKTGREVIVTPDHSVFTLKEDIVEIEAEKLKPGDKIIIPSFLPSGYSDIEYLYVHEVLNDNKLRFEGYEEILKNLIKKHGWKRISKLLDVDNAYVYLRKEKSKVYMPVEKYLKLAKTFNLDVDLFIKKGNSGTLLNKIPINEDIMWFFGIYVAKGYVRKNNTVVITNKDPTIINKVLEIYKKITGDYDLKHVTLRKIKGFGKSIQIQIFNSILGKLILKLGFGRVRKEKTIPDWIFGLKQVKINAFLNGLFSGDESYSFIKKEKRVRISLSSSSKDLIEKAAYLLLTLNIVSYIEKRGNLWSLWFDNTIYIDKFLRDVGFTRSDSCDYLNTWNKIKPKYTESSNNIINISYFLDKLNISRKYLHLKKNKRTSKYYLEKIADDICDGKLNLLFKGQFYLDEIKEIEVITQEPVYVYDLSVEPSQNFIGGFGGILLHNTEAKVLYEAMRVGAVGNVVMGTIHGENAYSVWDRLVNDLGVPTTSFKATDVVVTCAPVRFKGSLKRYRRLIEITCVGKHWYHDPEKEGGLINIVEYDINKDKHIFYPDRFKNSELMKKIQKFRGLTFEEVIDEIKARGEAKNYLVELKNKYNIPWILEADCTVKSHVKYMLFEERMREMYGSVDHKELLDVWKKWVNEELVKKNERK